MTDDIEIVKKIQAGDIELEEELLKKYKPIVSGKAKRYYLIGGDRDDLIQEGWIGLHKAIHSFNPEKHDNFKAYASLLIDRSIISAIRAENSHNKQIFDSSIFVENEEVLRTDYTPEDNFLKEETYLNLNKALQDNLSEMERKVCYLKYNQDMSYAEISEVLGISHKSIDNCLKRMKNKLRERL